MTAERSSLFKSTPAAESAADTNTYENFVLVVESYDLAAIPPVMNGIRMDTREAVSVSLRDVKGINKGEFKRPEVADFAKTRKFQNDPGVSPGGTVFIQDAIKTFDNQFGARWVSALSHVEGEAEVLICTAHYEGVRKGKDQVKAGQSVSGSPYSRVTVLFDGDGDHLSEEMREQLGFCMPFTVVSTAELRNDLLSLLERDLGAGIRLKEGDAFDALNLTRGSNADVSIEDVVDEFMLKKLPDGLDAMLAGGAMLEVIPYRTIFMGKKSAADSLKKQLAETAAVQAGGKPGKFLTKMNRYSSPTAQARTEPVYGKTLLVVRMSEVNDKGNRALYFTVVEPLFTRNETLVGLRDAVSYAQTSNFSPTVTFAASKPGAAEEKAPSDDQPAASYSSQAADDTQASQDAAASAASAASAKAEQATAAAAAAKAEAAALAAQAAAKAEAAAKAAAEAEAAAAALAAQAVKAEAEEGPGAAAPAVRRFTSNRR